MDDNDEGVCGGYLPCFSDEVTMTRQRTEEQKNGCRNKEAVDEVGNQGRYEHRRNDDEEVGEDEEQRSRR
jgi:hypothetical protein